METPRLICILILLSVAPSMTLSQTVSGSTEELCAAPQRDSKRGSCEANDRLATCLKRLETILVDPKNTLAKETKTPEEAASARARLLKLHNQWKNAKEAIKKLPDK